MNPVTPLAVQSAVLPFVRVWQALDPGFEVLSLESPPDGWKQLLTGQGIALREGAGAAGNIPPDTAVVSGFAVLDAHDAQSLESWARKALSALRPGGLMVLGGCNPDPLRASQRGLLPVAAEQALSAAGYARVCVIRPDINLGENSLSAALFGGSEAYAVVAQAPAFGKDFDVFSPVFLEVSSATPRALLRRAEDALLGRINHAEARLHDRITHVDTTFQERLQHSETALREQLEHAENALQDRQADIEHLRQIIAELQRLTRRRGLRKLVHRFKQKRQIQDPDLDLPAPETAPPPAPVVPPDFAAPPVPAQPGPTADPVPLSPRETRLRARLFGPKGS
ncbi:hypothetical protein Z945_3746 [Sulfitobacter noctilucae]|uniref:hypothetical protein n=1 Tax=Sulfitobacter noctilucae TaxID=1342302 RepID=UPI00046B099D|nr:hypothetical protein [Sulfitobacter noctilucae]KIN70143.1 hypothetical protein Z945_3746 [Sulfitobacter noctilucae]